MNYTRPSLKHYINRYNQAKTLSNKRYAPEEMRAAISDCELLNRKMEEASREIVRIVTGKQFLNRIEELSKHFNLGIMEIE